MKKLPAKRNPIAKALAKPQYRPRIKPDKRQKIEAKRMKRQHSDAAKPHGNHRDAHLDNRYRDWNR